MQAQMAPGQLEPMQFSEGQIMQKMEGNISFYLFVLLFLVLFLIGLINLIIFAIKKIGRKEIIASTESMDKLPLSAESSARMLFYTFLLVLILEVLGLIGARFIAADNINAQLSLSLIVNFMLQVSMIFLVLRFIPLKDSILRIKGRELFSSFRIYAALLPILLVVSVASQFFLKKLGVEQPISPTIIIFLFLKDKFILVFLMIQIIILAPIAEEFLFRGFIYRWVRKRFNFFLSALLTSLIFALLHRTAKDILPLTILSFGLCYAYEKTNRISSPIFIHFFHNSLTTIALTIVKKALF